MSHPDLNPSFVIIKSYFETEKCAQVGLASLKEGVEISLILHGSAAALGTPGLSAALFRTGSQNHVELRAAKKADVEFHLTEKAILQITDYKGAEVGPLGIKVVQQILVGEVKIRILGGLFALMSHGYLGIIKSGGADFMKILAQNGFSSLSKFPEIIKKMRQ